MTNDGARGLLLVLLGIVLVPVVLLIVALVPEGARPASFVLGLAVVSAVAGRGGWRARRAVADGTDTSVLAVAGAVLGLIVAATATMLCVWSVVGLLFS